MTPCVRACVVPLQPRCVQRPEGAGCWEQHCCCHFCCASAGPACLLCCLLLLPAHVACRVSHHQSPLLKHFNSSKAVVQFGAGCHQGEGGWGQTCAHTQAGVGQRPQRQLVSDKQPSSLCHRHSCLPCRVCVCGPAAAAPPFPRCPLQVLLDLREECERYGSVLDAVVPRPAEPSRAKELWGTANYGKVGESGGWECCSSTHGVCAVMCASLLEAERLGRGLGHCLLHHATAWWVHACNTAAWLHCCCCAQAFVAFTDAVESAKARERINGRMFAGNMVTVVYVTAAEFDAAKAAAAAGTSSAGADAAAAAEDAAAGVAAVGLVAHGSPSPDRGEAADKVRRGKGC